jgi:hypothetical protein
MLAKESVYNCDEKRNMVMMKTLKFSKLFALCSLKLDHFGTLGPNVMKIILHVPTTIIDKH